MTASLILNRLILEVTFLNIWLTSNDILIRFVRYLAKISSDFVINDFLKTFSRNGQIV